MYKLGYIDRAYISHIVDRSHVQDDDETVIRRVIQTLKNLTEEEEKAVRKFAIECHRKNQNFFYKEMRF